MVGGGLFADEFCWLAGGLTWEGHEFLDAARDDTRWSKAKKLVQEKGGSLMFEALKAVLVQTLKGQVLVGP
jgi:hypothetical protein